MNIENKILLLSDKNQKTAYHALKELLSLSEKSDEVYSYFDMFVEMMDNKNSYIRTRGLQLVAYNARWDKDDKLTPIIKEYLKHMEDEKPITARQCIKDTVIIARYKSELIPIILQSLASYGKTYNDSMQNLIYQDRKEAIRKIRQLI